MTEDMQYDGPPPHDDSCGIGDAVIFIIFGRETIGVITGFVGERVLIDAGAGGIGNRQRYDCWDDPMNAQQAMKHYKQHRTFYMDAAGHRALYKLIKRQAKIIERAKCTTADACARCESEYQDAGTCLSCHVWRLVQMINKEEERDGRKTTASD